MKTNVNDFNEETCRLFNPVEVFEYIHSSTHGDPCTTGCAFFDNGKCKGYTALSSNPAKIVKSHLITNAEIAKELHCSTRQVAKKRREGRLPDRFKDHSKEV